jgi:uncharacterized membrane protein
MWEKISRFYPPWLDVICIVCLGFVWIYTISRFGLMPEKIPTHFGFGGMPDAWSTKSFSSIFMLLVIGTLIWLSMFVVNYFLIIKPEDPQKLINLPQARKNAMGREQMEAIRKVTVQGMALINLTLVFMFALIQYGMVNTALGIQKGLGWGVNILVGGLLIETVWLTWKTISLSKSDSHARQ